MSANQPEECCPKFDPEPWDGREIRWQEERFVRDRVICLFHIPLNFGTVMRRNLRLIEAADAKPQNMVVLTDENSLWGADVYLQVAKDVPGARMTSISGTFLCKVFEGPYQNVRKWIGEMRALILGKGKAFLKLYIYYTTCPICAKKYGKNYVVLLAQV